MKITYYGHSCFTIESKGFVIALDPFAGVEGRADVSLEANGVYCSHEHFDHCFTDGVRLVDGGPNPFKITEIHSFHDDAQGALRGENIIRIFEAEGFRIAHFGDIGCELTEDQRSLLSGLDVALIPVGGTFTIDPLQAKALIESIKPVTTIPMHYRKGTLGFAKINSLSDFTDLYESVTTLPSPLDVAAKPSGIVVLEEA